MNCCHCSVQPLKQLQCSTRPVGLGNRIRATPTQNIWHTQQAELTRTYQCNVQVHGKPPWKSIWMIFWNGASTHHQRTPQVHQGNPIWHSLHIPTTRTQQWPHQQNHLYQEIQVRRQPLEHPKEILGWLFDGVLWCMQLPSNKVAKINSHLIQISRQKLVCLGKLEWVPHAYNDRHPKWMWAPIAAYCHHFHERKVKCLQQYTDLIIQQNKTGTTRLERIPPHCQYASNTMHQPAPSPSNVWQLLWCIEEQSWRHMVWY